LGKPENFQLEMGNVTVRLHGATGEITVDPTVFYKICGGEFLAAGTQYFLETCDKVRIIVEVTELADGLVPENATSEQLEIYLDNECALQA
jgi:hypothetical protein